MACSQWRFRLEESQGAMAFGVKKEKGVRGKYKFFHPALSSQRKRPFENRDSPFVHEKAL